jgi:hypothetical protein
LWRNARLPWPGRSGLLRSPGSARRATP